jgi:hypothetical protein
MTLYIQITGGSTELLWQESKNSDLCLSLASVLPDMDMKMAYLNTVENYRDSMANARVKFVFLP